jgi:hypothetical protein
MQFLFDFHCLNNDVLNNLGVGTAHQVAEEEAGEVSVHTLVTDDKFVRESKSGHEPSFLHPEDGREGAREEDALDSRKCQQTLSECWLLIRDPPESPLRVALDAINCFDGVEEILALSWVLDVCVDEKGVGHGVDVLRHNLEPIEATSLCGLNFIRERVNANLRRRSFSLFRPRLRLHHP